MALTNATRVAPGPRNALTDVAGLLVGNAEDAAVRTGTTVVLSDAGTRPVGAVSVYGGGPGTRETDALQPGKLVDRVDAVVLSGGSAYGLDAAGAVHAWLGARNRGFDTGVARVPIVPAAILFDLANGGDKAWGEDPPYRRLGRAAVEAASEHVPLGKVGAGMGARAGGLEGGLGTASAVDPETGATVAALVAVNSFGDAVLPDGRFYAAPYEQGDEFGGLGPSGARAMTEPAFPKIAGGRPPADRENTTIAVIATDAALDRLTLHQVTVMAQAGLARAVRPVFTPFDGDTVFGLATGHGPSVDTLGQARIGALAADCLCRAVARGVFAAESLGDFPSWRQRFGGRAAAE
jgi:L-aminopeptidase/D-esterase-like protein